MTTRTGKVIVNQTIPADGYSAGFGAGMRLFEGVPPLKLEQVTSRAAGSVMHVTYRVLG